MEFVGRERSTRRRTPSGNRLVTSRKLARSPRLKRSRTSGVVYLRSCVEETFYSFVDKERQHDQVLSPAGCSCALLPGCPCRGATNAEQWRFRNRGGHVQHLPRVPWTF